MTTPQKSPIVPVQPASLVDAIRDLRNAVQRLQFVTNVGSDGVTVDWSDERTYVNLRGLYPDPGEIERAGR